MRKVLLTILLFIPLLSACQKNSGNGINLLGSDQTQLAIDLITDANNDLKKIKAIYKANQNGIELLSSAMKDKDAEKVKTISNDLALQINEGLMLGESAITKIAKAKDLNINDTYKEYLRLKEEAIRNQLDAFEYRRQIAEVLRDGFGGKDPQKIERAKAIFREKDESFQKLMEEGKILSQEANQLAKESLKKQ